jgi:hypothetical protein
MGARYERAEPAGRAGDPRPPRADPDPDPDPDRDRRGEARTPEEIWDALDRGEDPTT